MVAENEAIVVGGVVACNARPFPKTQRRFASAARLLPLTKERIDLHRLVV